MYMYHWKVAGRLKRGVTCSRMGGMWDLLQSPNCKERVCPTAIHRRLLTSRDHFLAEYIRFLRNHAFSVASFDIYELIFLQNSKIDKTFFAELLRGIGRSHVVPCGDSAASYLVGAASIQATPGDR
jgi:hypothetical protein